MPSNSELYLPAHPRIHGGKINQCIDEFAAEIKFMSILSICPLHYELSGLVFTCSQLCAHMHMVPENYSIYSPIRYKFFHHLRLSLLQIISCLIHYSRESRPTTAKIYIILELDTVGADKLKQYIFNVVSFLLSPYFCAADYERRLVVQRLR